jgi:hypothetical protein
MNTMADSIGRACNENGAASFQPVPGPQLHGLLDDGDHRIEMTPALLQIRHFHYRNVN